MERAYRCRRALAHVRGSQQSPAAAVACQRETTAATVRILGSGACGIGPPTSSRRHFLLNRSGLTQDGSRARGQTENADEAGGILLVVALAHGERREVGAIERVVGFAASHCNIALVQTQSNGAGDFSLGACDEGVERFTKRSEPESEIDEFRILQRDVLLEVHQVAIETQSLELAVRHEQKRAARSLIASARLDTDEAILHEIDAAYTIASANIIQFFQQSDWIKMPAVDR